MLLHRRQFLQGAAASLATVSQAQPAKRPNFLILLADDTGFSDPGCYGGEIDTPNLDRLAANGLRFTQMYSTARCGPSRSCLLTGHYAQQTAADVMTPGNLPDYTRYIPDYLNALGYRTYHSGKWHLKHSPVSGGVGFHRSYTMLDEFRFFTQNRHELDGELLPKPGPGYYSTTAIADYGVQFLAQHARERRDEPFLLYAAFHAPHFPLHALQEDIDHYAQRFQEGWDVARKRRWQRMRRMGLIDCPLAPLEPGMWTRWNTPDQELLDKIGPGEVMRAAPWSSLTLEQRSFQRLKMSIHAAMITRMDKEIGKLLQQVDRMGATDNTVVLFLSDNGASSEQLIRGDGHDPNARPGSGETHLCLGPGWSSCANAPFRLHKSWVHEGGISSPLIVHWPRGVQDKGKLRHDPCHFVDVLPTLVDLAGGQPASPAGPPLAGMSLAPAFASNGAVKRDFLYFNHNQNRALRMGNAKLISTGKDGPWELYDMAKDRSEQKNLAASQQERTAEMAARWQAIDQEFTRVREGARPSTRKPLSRAATETKKG